MSEYINNVRALPLPAYAGDPEPLPPQPAQPFPGEPGDDPGAQPGDPGAEPPPADMERIPDAPFAGSAQSLAAMTEQLCVDIERVLDRERRRDQRVHRLDTALTAALLGLSSTLNFAFNAVNRMEPEDWRNNRDLAVSLHRQAAALSSLLQPVVTRLAH